MKNFLVIGGSKGIGQSIARQLAGEGHQVFATYNNTNPEPSNNISFHKLNVLDENPDLSFVPEELHGLAYCPGSIMLKPFARFSAEDYINDYKLQLLGAVSLIQKLLPQLKKPASSSIVLFSTVAVQSGFTFHTLVSSSKGAVEGFTRALAAEMAPRIRVNCIAPSITDTPLAAHLLNTPEKREATSQRQPLKRVGTAEEVANAACFLLNDSASWMTGQIMHVDGGMSSLRI